jgi:hypothetical protein
LPPDSYFSRIRARGKLIRRLRKLDNLELGGQRSYLGQEYAMKKFEVLRDPWKGQSAPSRANSQQWVVARHTVPHF